MSNRSGRRVTCRRGSLRSRAISSAVLPYTQRSREQFTVEVLKLDPGIPQHIRLRGGRYVRLVFIQRVGAFRQAEPSSR
jgi:hypothetical protein